MQKKLLQLHKYNAEIAGSISLPASKSISNRVLIINALSYSPLSINNLAKCDDTEQLQAALYSNDATFYTGDGGTTIRFLTAFLSKIVGEWVIDCSSSMKKRPIKILVDALHELGAKISYLEEKGYPPLKIEGSHLNGTKLTLSGNISSQYISAILLIAPTLPKGLEIKITGSIVSRSYIEMTLHIMGKFGINYEWKKNTIKVSPQDYKVCPYTVESDWTAASYWYAFLALSQKKGFLTLTGLHKDSCQGDSKQTRLWEKLGVNTKFTEKGAILEKTETTLPSLLTHDFRDFPDLAQTFVVVCTMLNITFHFTGLETLEIKETNRIVALTKELKKLGFILETSAKGELKWKGKKLESEKNITIDTYNDHRMAMAFAPISMLMPIEISDYDVVKKSYPEFWEHLQQVGISIDFQS